MPVDGSLPMPACMAMILACTISRALTCRKLMPIRLNMLTWALDMYAWNHSLP